MKKNKFFIIIMFIFIGICIFIPIYSRVMAMNVRVISLGNANYNDSLDEEILGIGGGGALFEPAISPFNSKDMLVVPDMGGIYISHNYGEDWERKNLHGTVAMAVYDPNLEGVIYAGGSGVWRSTDNGDNFELIFPNEDDIVTKRLSNGNSLQYYFTESKVYDQNKNIKSILIDPDDSNHIFVLGYYNKNSVVYESTDNGESFDRIFTCSKSKSTQIQFDFNELIYRKETKDLFLINDEFVMQYNLDTKKTNKVYESDTGLVDVSTVYENDKTYFVIAEKVDGRDDTKTILYYTNDFVNKTDLTDKIVSVQPNYFEHKTYGKVSYKYFFRYVSATSLNNIYVASYDYQESSSIKEYPYTIDGIIHYHDGEAKYLYGNPFHDHNNLSGRSWNDGCTYALGIAASKKNDNEFIFTTLNGVYYSDDNEHIYARHTKLVDGIYPNATFVTNGIDEQRTYGVMEDPFHDDVLLLLNTDLGLIRSEDNGKSWSWIRSGIPNSWQNTIYDAEFDKKREGVVYSLWSGRHNAPYNAGNETDGRNGGFAISHDSGKSWDANYSSGLPSYAIPVKMSVIYNDNSDDVTIYVATYNCGFYVSKDSGKTFIEMNQGIEKIKYKDDSKYHYIFAQDIEVVDNHIFGLTTKTSYNNSTQPGELFEYVNGSWKKISLPENTLNPVDIVYNEGVVYLSSTATSIWDYKNGADFNPYGAGVYAYKDGEFEQIFDEAISTTSVVFDSKGTMYISDMEGNIYRREKDQEEFLKIYEDFHYRSESMQITDDGDRIYLSTNGGGVLRLSNLNSLYGEHVHSGGVATCMHKAVCDVCGEEYGELDPNNHDSSETHIINQKDATCISEGYTGDVVYDCGEIKEKGSIIPKTEHKFDGGVTIKYPNYSEDGEKVYTCEVCHETKTEVIPKLNGEEVYYTVSFETSGGSLVSDVKIKEGSILNRPSVPTRDGYTFVEWQLNGEKYEFSEPVTKNIELVAIWKKNNQTNSGSDLDELIVDDGSHNLNGSNSGNGSNSSDGSYNSNNNDSYENSNEDYDSGVDNILNTDDGVDNDTIIDSGFESNENIKNDEKNSFNSFMLLVILGIGVLVILLIMFVKRVIDNQEA